MKIWPVQDAKARFSELLDACVSEGPQVVTRRGAETAVLVPIAEWKRLNNAARPTLKELLMTDEGRADFDLPQRGLAKRRASVAL
ncbi:MAG: type II toxin-antitoxin system Phd/YefM family antitoxin [Methylococcaceae bacterium]|nr:type II toxin-antitoxin system Phd/YefM family antitoxin [Methylococcaceae bacterium]